MHTGTYENDNTDLYRDNNSNLVLSFRSILRSKPPRKEWSALQSLCRFNIEQLNERFIL